MRRIVSAVFIALLAAASAQADTLALTGGSFTSTGAAGFVTGWSFTTSSTIFLTALGYYDEGKDGLLSSHAVGVFSSGGTLLVSTTVPSGAGGRLNADWRMESIPSFALNPGTYVIVGGTGLDPFVFIGSSTPAAGITLVSTHLYDNAPNGSLVFPYSIASYDYDNPNFEFTTAAVPEPASFALVGFGLVTLLAARRKFA